ncbi:carboxypeptidase M32 [Candidatus Izemoplasma sp. B36]|uniref:carboxypeptidase M32 n=1 Tax=Candidatus Izemoplasma sp. B36 TaxID=3242468 RepID=UPI0035572A01
MQSEKKFREISRKIDAYEYVLTIIGWDSSTEAPRKSFKRRAEMLGVITRELYALGVSKEYQDVVNDLYSRLDTLNDHLQREIKKANKELRRIRSIPEDEFVEYNKLLQLSQQAWEDAKKNNDYESFKGNLEKIIDFNKKFALYFEPEKDPYDTLLDRFEEGMSTKEYDEFFNHLKKELVPFVRKVLEVTNNKYDKFINDSFDPKKQEEFCNYLIDVFKFDRERGLMKKSVHPFTWNTSPEDVRFTTRYLENYVFSSIFAAIHELGHATYEQQISTDLDGTLLTGGTSMGIHESQSRFYENTIGRSLEFWETHLEKFKSYFPEQTKDIEAIDMFKAVNKVEASLIRVEADELTYPMHIMLRYDIERKLMSGEISVDELPKTWNDLMEEYLGIRPKTDSDGVLQDVHWSGGMIGYFPTYALGSAYSAQFYYAMKKDLDLEQLIKDNDISKVNEWLKEKIHKYGSSKTPKELLLEVTKEEFNAKYYVKYLIEKYSKIYF